MKHHNRTLLNPSHWNADFSRQPSAPLPAEAGVPVSGLRSGAFSCEKSLLTVITSLLLALSTFSATPPEPYGPLPNAAQLAWHEVEFYSIIHHSLNTYTDQEWGYGNESVTLFNPSNFNARAIADVCKQAGMRGINVVAKHHVGFCIWPTAYTDSINSRYNVANPNCPWKGGTGDMMREYSDACAEYGLKLGAYLSPWDRNHADYGYSNYVSYYHNQLQEVTTNYGPLFIVWFDGANGGNGWYGGCNCTRTIDAGTYYNWPAIYGIVASNQPLAATFGGTVRWVGNESAYAASPCWATMGPGGSGNSTTGVRVIGTNGIWKPAEADSKLRNGWFYHASEDNTVKSPSTLYGLYFQTVGNGAAWDLGLAPNKAGVLHTNDVSALIGLGQLLHRTFDNNLALSAHTISGNSRGGDPAFAPSNMLNTNYPTLYWHWDTNNPSYWATDDTETNATVILTFTNPISFSVVGLREYIPLGLRVDSWALDAWVNGQWQQVTANAGIGAHRYVRFSPTVTDQVRLRVYGPVAPAISYFGLYAEGGNAVWTGAGTDDNWSTADNWGGTVPQTGENLAFMGTTRQSNTNDLSGFSAGYVTLGNGGFNLAGNALTLTSGVSSTGTNTIGMNLSLGGGNFSSSGLLNLSGVLSGSAAMTLGGTGAYVIGGVNSASGNITVNQATVHVNPAATLFCSSLGWAVRSLTIQNGGVVEGYNWSNGASNFWGQCGDAAGNVVFGTGGGTFRLLGSTMNSINKGVTVNSSVTGRFEIASGLDCAWTGSYGGRDFIVNSGGTLIFDCDGNLATSRFIAGAGNVRKEGAGTLTLSNACTYSGTTTVAAGTLALGAGGSIASTPGITVSPGALFDVTGRGSFTVGTSQTLTAGRVAGAGTDIVGVLTNKGDIYIGATGVAATLTVSSNLALAGGTLYFDLANVTTAGGGTNDLITANGGLDLSGTTIIQINLLNGSLASGDYILIAGNSLTSGSAANLALGSGLPSGGRQSYSLDTATIPGTVLLKVTGTPTAALRWTGSNGSNWDFSSSNWLNGAVSDRFYNLDSVLFDDSSPNGNVNLVGNVYPGGLVVSNSATAYTFSGSGGVTGAVGLTKNGGGTLTLANTNTFSGATAINAGTLQIGNGGASGSLAGAITNDAALVFNRSDSYTPAGLVSGSGTLAQSGSGTLILTNQHTYTGLTFANAGTLALNPVGGTAFPGDAAVNSGGTLRLDTATALAPTALVTVNSGGTFDRNGFSPALGGLAGAGDVTGPSGLYIDGVSASPVFSGTLGGALYIRGANNLGGTQLFSGNSTISTLFVGYQTGNLDGNLELAGGSLTVNGDTYIGGGTALSASESVLGSLTVSGGTLTLNGANFLMGQSINGSTKVAQFTQTAGDVVVNSGWAAIANGGGTSQLDLSGGTFTLSPTATYPGLRFGVRGSATLNISGTAQVSLPSITFFLSDATTGDGKFATLNLSGGTLTVGSVAAGTTLSTSTLNLNGGTLQASASTATFLQGLSYAYIQNGGAVIDASTNTITINQALLNGGSGGLTKLGSGTMTLNGANTYSGITAINAGTLALGVSGSFDSSSEVRLQSGAGLDTTGHGGLTIPPGQTLSGAGTVLGDIASSGIVSPGTNGLGTLTFSNNLSLAGIAQMEINKSAPASNDVVIVAGTLTLGGNLTVTNTGPALVAGDSFRLFNAASTGSQFNSFDLPALGAGLFWNRGSLALNGALRVETLPSLQVQPLSSGATNLAMQVQSSVGLNYILETSAVLAPSPTWTPVATNQGTGGTLVFNVPVLAGPQAFYRLRMD